MFEVGDGDQLYRVRHQSWRRRIDLPISNVKSYWAAVELVPLGKINAYMDFHAFVHDLHDSQKELLIASLSQQQLSKPHGKGPILFTLNCSTMPKDPPQISGPAYDLILPTLRAIQEKQRSAMSLHQLAMRLVYARKLSSTSESPSQLADHRKDAQTSQEARTVHRSLYCYLLSGGSSTISKTLCGPTASISPPVDVRAVLR